MGWQVRRERIRYDTDDTGAPFGFVYASSPPEEPAPDDEPYEDALDMRHRASRRRTWPEWSCECGQRNRGRDLACCWCGTTRDDVDQCG